MAVGGWKLQKHDQADDLCNSYCYGPFTAVIVTIGKTSPWRQEKVAAYVTASVGFLALLHACPCLSLSRALFSVPGHGSFRRWHAVPVTG